jgi:ABC-type antimicrobial peptide transport system permease subunit
LREENEPNLAAIQNILSAFQLQTGQNRHLQFGGPANLLFTGLLAPVVSPYNPYDPANIDIMNSELPPSWTEDGEAAFCWAPTSRGATCSAP